MNDYMSPRHEETEDKDADQLHGYSTVKPV